VPVLSVFIARPSTCAGATNDSLFIRRGRSSMLRRVTALGHEERFPPTKLSAGYGFRKETIAGMRRNGRDAPIPAVRSTMMEPPGLTHLRTSCPRHRLVVWPRKRSFASDFWSC
jgi:hypothetical protein